MYAMPIPARRDSYFDEISIFPVEDSFLAITTAFLAQRNARVQLAIRIVRKFG